ncbi:MAG: DUF4097 family beta strand repeat protein [Acholeplasmatales bacterium]|nr:DUF4097 family beta strand repeat protein [Acholeplasmatales bacterium]
MFKFLKVIFGIIIFLIIIAIAFVVTLVVINWNNKPKKKEMTTTNKISDLTSLTVNVDVKDAYVTVKKSSTDYVNVKYYACKTRTFDINEEVDTFGNSTLTIKGYQTGKWYNRIFFTLNTTKVYGVTIEVPDDVNVSVKTDNGNVRFEEVYLSYAFADVNNGAVLFKKSNASVCSFSTVNGNVEVDSSNVATFYSRSKKGRIVLENLVALMTIDAATDNGKIILSNSYATGNITLHSGKGTIKGTIRLLSDAYYKITTKAVNGKSNLENTTTGVAELNVTTDNGDIELKLNKVLG